MRKTKQKQDSSNNKNCIIAIENGIDRTFYPDRYLTRFPSQQESSCSTCCHLSSSQLWALTVYAFAAEAIVASPFDSIVTPEIKRVQTSLSARNRPLFYFFSDGSTRLKITASADPRASESAAFSFERLAFHAAIFL